MGVVGGLSLKTEERAEQVGLGGLGRATPTGVCRQPVAC